MHRSSKVLGILIVVALSLAGVSAQTTATLSGTARDSGGGILPGLAVTISSPTLSRGEVSVITDDEGRYSIPGLQAGTYSLRAELDGFATLNKTGIKVAVNSQVVENITMEVAQLTQEITVSSDALVVRTAESDLQEQIGTQQIDNLPLNGRQFLDLMALAPAVASRPPDSDQGADVTVFGERSITNSFLTDGLDNNDPVNRNFNDFFIQDAIQEFQVLLGGYQAEFGRAQGAVTNVITRSGTDRFHGRFFYFVRNDALDSSNIEGQSPEGLDRQEVGGTLGGPIWKEKTHFFYAFQYLDEQRAANFDQSIIPPIIASGYYTPSIGTEPFDFVPLENRYTNFFKVDHQLNAANQLFFTLNTNRQDVSLIPPALGAPPGTISLPSTASDVRVETDSVNVRHTGFFNTTTFLETSFRFSQTDFGENDQKPEGAEQIFPITFSPFAIWASNGPLVDATTQQVDQFQFTENLSYIVGDHGLKFGFDLLRNDLFNERRPRQSIILGNSILEPNDAFNTLGYDVSQQRANNRIVSPNTNTEAVDNQIGFFAQDSWQIRPGVTLNLGLRYDVSTFFDDDKNNVAPRIGFAWDIGARGRTVIRASWGRFFDQNILGIIPGTPELGGIQQAAFDVQVIPRGGAFFLNPDIGAFGPLQFSSSRFLSNPLFMQFISPLGRVTSSGACSITGMGRPLILYDMLGIAVTNPGNPPPLTATSIPQLTNGAFTAASALALFNAAFSPAANAAALPGCPNPGGAQFDFLQETGPNSINNGQPLIFLFRQLAPSVDAIQTLRRPTSTPYTDSFNIGIQHDLGHDFSIDFQYFNRRSRDLLTRRVINLLPQPVSASCAGNTLEGFCNRQLEYLGFLNSNAVTVSFRKRFSRKYSFLTNYTYTNATDNFSTLRVPPPAGEVSFLFNNDPSLDEGRSLNTPVHNLVFSGLYQLPWDFIISGVVRGQSGRPFNAIGIGSDSDGDNIFDNRLIGTEKGQFKTDPFFQSDLRVTKEFKFGESLKATALIEVFNLFNNANPFEVNRNCDDSDGDGNPDPAGCGGPSFGQVIRPFPGREIQLGFKFDF